MFRNLYTSITIPVFSSSYTGHASPDHGRREQIDVLGIINMNGRTYDPRLGMFPLSRGSVTVSYILWGCASYLIRRQSLLGYIRRRRSLRRTWGEM